jgi:hypothetical protein
MTDSEKLADLNSRFVPTKDRVLENWRIMKEPTGPLKGDCEDWSLTALWYLSDRNMKTFWKNQRNGSAKIVYTKTPDGTKHIMLSWKGRWIDNLNPKFSTEPIYKPISGVPFFAVWFMLLLGRIWK